MAEMSKGPKATRRLDGLETASFSGLGELTQAFRQKTDNDPKVDQGLEAIRALRNQFRDSKLPPQA